MLPFGVESDCEISLEANPTSVEAERLRGFRAAGVNRVSMGIQSLNDQDLKKIGAPPYSTRGFEVF